jgi:hypothetical protein
MQAYVVNRDKVTAQVIDDEAVILHADTSEYFGLNQSATWLWMRMDTPRTAAELIAAIAARYRHAAADVGQDVEDFLSRLTQATLIVPVEGAASPAEPGDAPDESHPRDGYEPPQLVKFGHLETLILSGE